MDTFLSVFVNFRSASNICAKYFIISSGKIYLLFSALLFIHNSKILCTASYNRSVPPDLSCNSYNSLTISRIGRITEFFFIVSL